MDSRWGSEDFQVKLVVADSIAGIPQDRGRDDFCKGTALSCLSCQL